MPSRWVIGPVQLRRGDGVLALTLDEARRAQSAGVECVLFHQVSRSELARAPEVAVVVPRWRGNSFLVYLEWLVRVRLTADQAEVSWSVERRVGRRGIESLLGPRGWALRHEIAGAHRRLSGPVPPDGAGPEPEPASFEHEGLRFASDWGVFSEGHIDEGTALLLEAARHGEAASCCDVGTGCGVLAALLGRSARSVVASDVDAVALDLARRNCSGMDASFFCEDHPEALPRTDITLCNFPTHASADQTEVLVSGLAARTEHGPVLVVVHGSLERRFAKLFAEAGAPCRPVARAGHVVLRAS